MRILCYSDTPVAVTGFGRVVANIFGPLIESDWIKAEDVPCFGINSTGEPHNTPFRVWPALMGLSPDRDPYGRARFLDMIMRNAFGDFDILWMLLDHFSLAQPMNINGQMVPFNQAVVQLARQRPGCKPFRAVQYCPVDSEAVRPEWIVHLPSICDSVVAYTQFGQCVLLNACPSLRDKLRVIPHGTNPELFHPVPEAQREDFRQNVFRVKPGQPLILNMNRNQPRKDPVRSLQIFAKVREQIQDAKLYMHCNVVDSMGFNLDQARAGLRLPSDSVIFPQNFNEGIGVPVEALNLIYNAADVSLTTARGEGWGLGITESMCVGLPVVAPDHTSVGEILADGRGILVPPEPERQIMIADNDQLRPVADVNVMAEKVIWALQHREEARAIGRKGQEWATKLSWRTVVVPQWRALFEELMQPPKPVLKVVPKRMTFNTKPAIAPKVC